MAEVPFDDYGPFDSGVGALRTEDWWRDYARHFLTDGVLKGEQNDLEAFGDSTGLQVKVRTGRFYGRSHWAKLTSQEILAIDGNSSGNARIDRVVVRVNAATNTMALDVLKGTPASSPSAPVCATGASNIWEWSLAQVAVANGATTIAAADVTDERTYAMPGGTTKLSCRAYRATDQTIADDTLTTVEFGTESWDDAAFHSTSSNTGDFVARWSGRYAINVSVEFLAALGGAVGWRRVSLFQNGNSTLIDTINAESFSAANTIAKLHIPELRLTAGDFVRVRARQNAGGNLAIVGNDNGGQTWVIWRYLGA